MHVADSTASRSPPPVVSLAPLIALLSLLSNRERDSMCRACFAAKHGYKAVQELAISLLIFTCV